MLIKRVSIGRVYNPTNITALRLTLHLASLTRNGAPSIGTPTQSTS